MTLIEWEQSTFSQLEQGMKPLIYCQEFIYLDDTTVLGIAEYPKSTQHGFKTNIFNNWNSSFTQSKWNVNIMQNNYITKEVE